MDLGLYEAAKQTQLSTLNGPPVSLRLTYKAHGLSPPKLPFDPGVIDLAEVTHAKIPAPAPGEVAPQDLQFRFVCVHLQEIVLNCVVVSARLRKLGKPFVSNLSSTVLK